MGNLQIARFSLSILDTADEPQLVVHLDEEPPKIMDAETLAHLIIVGYERTERAMTRFMYDPNDRVLECGGGIGWVAQDIAARAGYLVSVEALRDKFTFLETNLRQLNRDNWTIYNAILTPDDTPIGFGRRAEWYGSSMVQNADAVVEVLEDIPCLAFPLVVREHRINALHLDMEGGERLLLETISLDGINKLVMEIHPRQLGGEKEADRILLMVIAQGLIPVAVAGAYNYPRHTYLVCFARDPESIDVPDAFSSQVKDITILNEFIS